MKDIKKKKVCKHKWAFIPKSTNFTMCTASGNGGYEAVAICEKCLEKRYI
jgi:hypothetical protein